MPESAIVDISALIGLERLHLSHVLCELYSEIILPEAVCDEFGRTDFPCLSIRRSHSHLMDLLVRELRPGRGESQVIALGIELGIRVFDSSVNANCIEEESVECIR